MARRYGGTPLACAVALKILEVIQREKLADNARAGWGFSQGRSAGSWREQYPGVIRQVRGLGLMLGLELAPDIPNLPGDAQDAGGPVCEPAARRRLADHPRRRAGDAAFCRRSTCGRARRKKD